MKLEFTLLIVDDAPDNVAQAIGILEDYLRSKGFSLKREVADDLSEQGMKNLAILQGKNYDLVMVDYNLGHKDRDGALITDELRRELRYVDMIFYSSLPVPRLLEYLAKRKVSGVFAERREDLGEALTGLADTVIGKAIDLDHMRGIAMAEVAEMDVLMEHTLVRAFGSNDTQINDARNKTITRLRENIKKRSQRLEDCLSNGGLPAVVSDSLLFSLTNKYQAIRRVAKCLPKEIRDQINDQVKIIGCYNEDIILNRNMLAHAEEKQNSEDGKTVLQSTGANQKEVIIDDEWMSDFRQKLQRHTDALGTICSALDSEFGGTRTVNDTKERQS